MKTIETSSAQEIAEYLEYLYNIARDKAFKNYYDYSKISKIHDDNAWEKLYHKVFSDEISRAICNTFPNFDWCDPDTSYYEDVNAFIEAFKNYAKNNSNEDGELFPSINTYFENKDN